MKPTKDTKTSKLISTSEYYNNHSVFSRNKLQNQGTSKSSINNSLSYNDRTSLPKRITKSSMHLPNEILVKIFDYLNINDLKICSEVCKEWYDAANFSYFWLKWSRTYQFEPELIKLVDETGFTHKQCFRKIFEQKIKLSLFKLSQKVAKRINRYTNLPDVNGLQNDIGNLEWSLNFFDKRMNNLFSIKSSEQNNFEASLSVAWFNLSQYSEKFNNEIEKIKLFASIPVYVDLKTGKLTGLKTKTSNVNVNNKKVVIKEMDFNFNDFRNKKFKNFTANQKYNGQLINIYEINKEFIFGFWNSSEYSNELAFVSFNMIFDFDFIEKLFSDKNSIENNIGKKSETSKFRNDLELDSKYGLHDYKIYFCIRNQTKTTFLSYSQLVYKADFKKYDKIEYLHLDVIKCNMENNVGPELKMLPKFTWKTEMNPKNNIDLFGIIDLCIFDSNKRLIISNSFPINFSKETDVLDSNDKFIVSNNLKFNYKDERFVLDASISCLKEEFTWKDSISYHLTDLDIYIPLEFVDLMFGTKFSKEKINVK